MNNVTSRMEKPVSDQTLEPQRTVPLEPPELAALYTAHSRYVYYLALRVLGDSNLAEDATHDIFLKVFEHLRQFRGESQLRTWLYRITLNHCQNLLRRWHYRHIVCQTDDTLWDRRPAPTDNPLRVLENKELGERIQQALNKLPEDYQFLLLLVTDEQLSYEEVATLTDQSTDAVRGKLYRARKAFAVEFQKTE